MLITILIAIGIFLSGCWKENNSTFERIQRRIILFGIDGATWDVIDPLLAEGKLPNMAKLIESGTRANLKTLTPTDSPRIWTSILTGVLPEIHGIESFVVKIPDAEYSTLPSSNMRKAKALWNILSEFGYSVGIVGWWASFPAEEVNGFIISDHANYIRKDIFKDLLNLTDKGMSQKEEKEVYPPELYQELSNSIRISTKMKPDLVNRFAKLPADKFDELERQQSYSIENKLSILKFGLLNDMSFIESGFFAIQKYNPDFTAFYLSGLDAIEHHFWKYMEPEKFNMAIPEEEIRLYDNVIKKYYMYMDEILGKLISLYSDDKTTMVVISDHGFEANPHHGTKGPHEVGYSGYHENSPDGIFVISGMDIEKKGKLINPTVLDIMPTLLALMGLPVGKDMPGKVLKNAINKSFFESHPVEKIPSYSSGWEHSSTPIESENVKTLKEKLKALGYIN